jgi:hypothetical protein
MKMARCGFAAGRYRQLGGDTFLPRGLKIRAAFLQPGGQ